MDTIKLLMVKKEETPSICSVNATLTRLILKPVCYFKDQFEDVDHL